LGDYYGGLSDARERSGMVEEARLEELDSGLAPVTDGWSERGSPDAALLRRVTRILELLDI
jgi:hypothetical protein